MTAFNDLKLGKSTKWIIYKISDDYKEVVVEETSTSADYSAFREKLLNCKSKDKRGQEVMGGRYAVYDMEYDSPGGEGKRYVYQTLMAAYGRDDTAVLNIPRLLLTLHCWIWTSG